MDTEINKKLMIAIALSNEYIKRQKYILQCIYALDFCDDSDSEEEEEKLCRQNAFIASIQKKEINKIQYFVSSVVEGYDEKEFQENFRLTRNAFEKLLSLVQPHFTKHHTGPEPLDTKQQLLSVIWLLATPESYRSVSERFDMSRSSLSRSFFKIINVLKTLSASIISWPNEEQRQLNKKKFQKYAGLQNIIGAIDGTYVPIKAPKEHAYAYTNRKKFCAITLQAVCDADLKFMDCSAGYPSSVHDARVFKNSRIFKMIECKKEEYCPIDAVILGDKAYPNNSWCIAPFKDTGRLSRKQKKFNKAHASTRQVIERCFALYFGRWRRLHYLDMNNLEDMPRTIMACCILHNICLMYEDGMTEQFIREGRLIAEISQSNTNEAHRVARLSGNIVRNEMVEKLWST